MKKILLFLVVIALNAFAVTSAEVEKSWDNMVNAMAEITHLTFFVKKFLIFNLKCKK